MDTASNIIQVTAAIVDLWIMDTFIWEVAHVISDIEKLMYYLFGEVNGGHIVHIIEVVCISEGPLLDKVWQKIST